ncbi:hypothetical protein ACR9PT_11145 [Piscirickettsia salmonis]|uniref:hypothetical protein n=1 Tax=Piscirickettsia salmonis TaxID=1238 RepID=UPI003EB9D5C8
MTLGVDFRSMTAIDIFHFLKNDVSLRCLGDTRFLSEESDSVKESDIELAKKKSSQADSTTINSIILKQGCPLCHSDLLCFDKLINLQRSSIGYYYPRAACTVCESMVSTHQHEPDNPKTISDFKSKKSKNHRFLSEYPMIDRITIGFIQRAFVNNEWWEFDINTLLEKSKT